MRDIEYAQSCLVLRLKITINIHIFIDSFSQSKPSLHISLLSTSIFHEQSIRFANRIPKNTSNSQLKLKFDVKEDWFQYAWLPYTALQSLCMFIAVENIFSLNQNRFIHVSNAKLKKKKMMHWKNKFCSICRNFSYESFFFSLLDRRHSNSNINFIKYFVDSNYYKLWCEKKLCHAVRIQKWWKKYLLWWILW